MNHIILISENKIHEQFAKSLAARVNAKLAISLTIEGIHGLEDSDTLLAIFLDFNIPKILAEFETIFEGNIPRNKIHLIMSPGPQIFIENIIDSPDVGHLLVANFNEPSAIDEATRRYASIVEASTRTSLKGISAFLPEGSETSDKVITESLQKRFIVEGIHSQLLKKNWHNKIASTVVNAIDELIMNAIYDAPIDSNGQQLYLTTPRSKSMKLEGDSQVQIQMSIQDDYFMASIIDNFGSMKRKRILDHVLKAFSENLRIDASAVQQGAGLGLALIFRSGGSLSFACHTGHKTEVTVFFAKADTFVQFKNQFQFITTYFDT